MNTNSFRSRLASGCTPELRAEIESAVLARREERTGHSDWGLLCEEAGLLALAFREFQLALRDDPDDPLASYRLALHYRERGESDRAVHLLERLLKVHPGQEDWLRLYIDIQRDDDAAPKIQAALDRALEAGLPRERIAALAPEPAEKPPPEPETGSLAPSDADCIRFQTLFAGREDVHARQWAQQGGDTGYTPVHEPMTPAVVRNHLLGTYTVGVYPIRLDGTCNFFALDLDIDRAALERARAQHQYAHELRETLRAEAARILGLFRELDLPLLFEDSGYKGRHFWVFLEQPEAAEVLHTLGRLLLAWQAPLLARGLHLEFFPKQAARTGKGLGNLIKVPLGIHRRTGRRAMLLDPAGKPLAEPLHALRAVNRLSRARLYAVIEQLKGLKLTVPAATAEPTALKAEVQPAGGRAPRPPGPPAPPAAPVWTDADFDADPRMRHLLGHCPVLRALKEKVDQHRQLSHEEQLVLIHTLGHLEGGPLAVNYLFAKCADVGPEKLMKDRLKGNPVSCPSIRKKIAHITRRLPCNCPFDFAADRYPTPVLHLLTLKQPLPAKGSIAHPDAENIARRYAALLMRKQEIEREYAEMVKSLAAVLRISPDRAIACPGGRYRLLEEQGVEEIRWEPEAGARGGPAGAGQAGNQG